MSYVWLNGNFLSSDEINIQSLRDGCCNSGAFENVCFYNNKIFQLEQHIERLFYSARTLLMDISFSVDNLYQECIKLVEINKLKNGYINLVVFINRKENNIDIAIFCLPRINNYTENINDKKSLSLEISSTTSLIIKSSIYQSKVSNLHATNDIAKKNALANGYDDALMLDYRGFVTQATSSNFFMIKNGNLYTPPSEFCLNGITRQTVMQIAQANDVLIIEKHINKEELFEADEIFLTETTSEMNSISSINEYNFQNNIITQMLYSKFYQLTQG